MIDIEVVHKDFGGRAAVRELSMRIPAGKISVLLGPSGCGKSTTLRMINRLIHPDRGRIRIDGRDIATQNEQTLRRGIGYAIQAGGLFPHWNVARNIATVPGLLGWPQARIAARVEALLALVRLPPDTGARYPGELSGGQMQRVGVARALAADAPLLLMDEPFGALDPITRRDLQRELRRIQAETGKTIVLVTHDMDEALFLADEIFVLEAGGLAQHGTPADLLQNPASDFVRDFIGSDALRRLSVLHVSERCQKAPAISAPGIAAEATLRDALLAMLRTRTEILSVTDADGAPIGSLRFVDLFG